MNLQWCSSQAPQTGHHFRVGLTEEVQRQGNPRRKAKLTIKNNKNVPFLFQPWWLGGRAVKKMSHFYNKIDFTTKYVIH